MPNYLSSRLKAYRTISSMVSQGKPYVEILDYVSRTYGFGKHFVDEQIKILQELSNQEQQPNHNT